MGAENIVVQFFYQFDAMQGNFSPERFIDGFEAIAEKKIQIALFIKLHSGPKFTAYL